MHTVVHICMWVSLPCWRLHILIHDRCLLRRLGINRLDRRSFLYRQRNLVALQLGRPLIIQNKCAMRFIRWSLESFVHVVVRLAGDVVVVVAFAADWDFGRFRIRGVHFDLFDFYRWAVVLLLLKAGVWSWIRPSLFAHWNSLWSVLIIVGREVSLGRSAVGFQSAFGLMVICVAIFQSWS